jgi:hypothetical protein
VPAAAVIPAPQVYIYVAAVKKLVVGSACLASGSTFGCYWNATQMCWFAVDALNRVSVVASEFTLKKLECSKQAFRLNISAWNNRIGLRFYSVGFRNAR